MKKIAIAALAALTAVSLAACGGEKKNDGSGRVKKLPAVNTTDDEDLVQTVSESKSAEESEEELSSDDDGRIVIELKDPDEENGSDKADTSEAAEKKEKKALFTFSADGDKWKVEQDKNSASIIYNGDDIEFAKGNCTIMINSREIEDMPDRTLSEVADAIVDSKGLTSSVEVASRGESVLGGHDAYTLDCIYTVKNVDFDLEITVMAEGTSVLEVWVMSYEDCTDAMRSNFDEVLKTIRFDL